MAIARKPNVNRSASTNRDAEQAASAFIHGVGKVAVEEVAPPATDARKTPIMLRFNTAAKRRGISRSAWIAFKVSEALDAEGA